MSDLQSFLHDLFSALRQAGRSGHGGREHEHWHERVPAASTTSAAPATTAPGTPGGAPIPATTAPSSTAPSTTTTAPSTAANPGIGAYGQRGIIAELNALVQDLSGTNSASGVSPRLLSNLNSAFEKLISDLKGASSAASSTSSASTSSTGSTSPAVGTASSTAAAGTSDQSTAALQSFLTNFAQDLKNNGANSFSPLGSSVNTTA
ncbi:MAG TPA: hypothetical protein VK793_02170 [Steroidobacteraceae bacterium]|nr:hypothetical protein [Steroidobacteraceae bacterium]